VAYVECPECGFRVSASLGFVAESCPRCLGRRGRRVWLEAKLGSLRQGGRFERAKKVREGELREARLRGEPQPAEE
jgi:hypothetical protein